MCYSKSSYNSERAAEKGAKKATLHYKTQFRFYLCPICLLWHITKSPKNSETEINLINKCQQLQNKIQYDTEEEAKTSQPGAGRFLCKFCGKWHITSVVKKPEQWIL